MNRASFLKRIAMAMAASALFKVEWPRTSPLELLEPGTIVCWIGDRGFYTLAAAINAASPGDDVVVLATGAFEVS